MKRLQSALLHGLLLAVLTFVPISLFSSPTGEQNSEAKVETMQSGVSVGFYGGGPRYYRGGYYRGYYGYPRYYYNYPYYRGYYYPGYYNYYWW